VAWRGTWAQDGGVFTNQASHHIDLLQWMMGPVVSVKSFMGTMLHDIEVEDTGVAMLRFKNGAMGVIEATTCINPVDLEGSLNVYGSGGTVEISGFAADSLKTWNMNNEDEFDAETRTDFSRNPDEFAYNHGEFLRHCIDAVINDTKAPIDGNEGRKSLELINAIYTSAEKGKEIYLADGPHASKLGRTQGR